MDLVSDDVDTEFNGRYVRTSQVVGKRFVFVREDGARAYFEDGWVFENGDMLMQEQIAGYQGQPDSGKDWNFSLDGLVAIKIC